MAKSKIVQLPKIKDHPNISNTEQLKKIKLLALDKAKHSDKKIEGIKIEGEYVIWPTGLRTHLRFIKEAVMKRRPVPVGFYDEAKRLNLPNLNVLAARAKSLGLKDSVGK